MPIWICPSCQSRMNVKDTLVGQVRACASCKEESTVTDSAAGAGQPAWLPRTKTKKVEKSLAPGIVTRAVLSLLVVGLLLAAIANEDFPVLRAHAQAALLPVALLLIVMWPIYGLCADVRKIADKLDRDE